MNLINLEAKKYQDAGQKDLFKKQNEDNQSLFEREEDKNG